MPIVACIFARGRSGLAAAGKISLFSEDLWDAAHLVNAVELVIHEPSDDASLSD
jgi:hypothetical protein